ncbi:hypothetical protein BKA93DRAFT_48156 [Sparassis latifolia]
MLLKIIRPGRNAAGPLGRPVCLRAGFSPSVQALADCTQQQRQTSEFVPFTLEISAQLQSPDFEYRNCDQRFQRSPQRLPQRQLHCPHDIIRLPFNLLQRLRCMTVLRISPRGGYLPSSPAVAPTYCFRKARARSHSADLSEGNCPGEPEAVIQYCVQRCFGTILYSRCAFYGGCGC